MRSILIEDTGSFLLVDCPMVKLKVTVDECQRCPHHRGKTRAIMKETIIGDPEHLFVAGSIDCNYSEESETKA